MLDIKDMIQIKQASTKDIPDLKMIVDEVGAHKIDNYFDIALSQRDIFFCPGKAYVMLNWNPIYCLYRRLKIPEIQDLNVIPNQRRKGIATALINYCEELAIKNNKAMMGISVGLYSDYGKAQRLYTKLGYMPDGNGVTYDREIVHPMSMQCLDDNLCLMLIKTLIPSD